jgi:hypothetical protein
MRRLLWYGNSSGSDCNPNSSDNPVCLSVQSYGTYCQHLQPKWHLTFDGHLLDCVKSCGGLADKSDDQEWKRLQESFCRIRNFEQQQKCIMRAWRRQQHYSIVAAVAEFEAKRPKHSSATNRKKKAEARVADEKKIKKVKREGYVHDAG